MTVMLYQKYNEFPSKINNAPLNGFADQTDEYRSACETTVR